MARSTWTEADRAELCRRLHGATSLTSVASELGRSVGSLAGVVAKLRANGDDRLPERWLNPQRRDRLARAAVDPSVLPPVVNRDPCFRCGVRRDVGCIHTAHEREPAINHEGA